MGNSDFPLSFLPFLLDAQPLSPSKPRALLHLHPLSSLLHVLSKASACRQAGQGQARGFSSLLLTVPVWHRLYARHPGMTSPRSTSPLSPNPAKAP